MFRTSLPLTLLAACLLFLASSCSSVEFTRDSQSSGTFVATGTSFTLFGTDLPRSALNQARENASDSGQHNLVVTRVDVWPYLGPFEFLMEILSIRYARIEGTWGYIED